MRPMKALATRLKNLRTIVQARTMYRAIHQRPLAFQHLRGTRKLQLSIMLPSNSRTDGVKLKASVNDLAARTKSLSCCNCLRLGQETLLGSRCGMGGLDCIVSLLYPVFFSWETARYDCNVFFVVVVVFFFVFFFLFF